MKWVIFLIHYRLYTTNTLDLSINRLIYHLYQLDETRN